MPNIDNEIVKKYEEIHDVLSIPSFNEYLEKINILETDELVYDLREFDNNEIVYAISKIKEEYPVYSKCDLTTLYIKNKFDGNLKTNVLSKKEFEYLLDMLENNLDVDISYYEDLLKINYNYKYKDRIEKLLKRKYINNRNVNCNFDKLEGIQLLYKMLLSVTNFKLDNFYSFNKDLYSEKQFKQQAIIDYLINLGFTNVSKELLECIKNNDFKGLLSVLEDMDLSNKNINDIRNIVEDSFDKDDFDLSSLETPDYSDINFDDFLDSSSIDAETLINAFKLVSDNFKDDISNNVSFEDAIKNKDSESLDFILLKLKDIYKTVGINVDIDYIKENINDPKYLKELFVLKTLYKIALYQRNNKINIKDILTKKEFFEEMIRITEGKNTKNLAFKYNSFKLDEKDIEMILLMLDGSNKLKTIPKKDILENKVGVILEKRVENLIKKPEELYKSCNKDNIVEKYQKYFKNLDKIEGISKKEKEVDIYLELLYLKRRRLEELYFSIYDRNSYNQILNYVRDKLTKDELDNLEKIDKKIDKVEEQVNKHKNDTSYERAFNNTIKKYYNEINELMTNFNEMTIAYSNIKGASKENLKVNYDEASRYVVEKITELQNDASNLLSENKRIENNDKAKSIKVNLNDEAEKLGFVILAPDEVERDLNRNRNK